MFRGNDAENAGDYEGPREAKGIVTHLKKQAGPPTSLLEDAAAVTTFAKFDTEKDAVGKTQGLLPTCGLIDRG